ncbi:N-acetylglucosamine-6-phosphate deacetylase [Roseburia sp. OF03-24]|uniref:N-acetylglucosamine-6-phosphate deacetylase n=1 Tax=Roseburia TaxID=841 RepID=UPI000E542301|nr:MULTISPECIES: N-acetylglucosamine-6-phosphate deacetylase [Roseburia]RGX93654.1 N-acetylglucosamine-6-phosphate deacetylase [Roseburia sp. OF03-24]UMZ00566.1 N-acetylglucosamine-6-phosphate deacetylase [Roseburia rectibacter]
MIIKNAMVYTSDHRFEKKDIRIKDERIAEIAEHGALEATEEDVVDGAEMYAIPGLVDIHFHGAVGYDFCQASKEELLKIAEYEAKNGVLAICPATMSYNEEILGHIMDKAADYQEDTGADLVGINMEGPFINIKKAGAQNPEYIMPADKEMFLRLQERSGGLIRLVDIAPEGEGAMEFIEQCHDKVKISIAHTCCDYDTACKALKKGASHMTHLYNAMPGINHREPGPVIAALEAGAEVELIADGIHIHPAMVRTTFRIFGADKVILISDSMEATGLLDGDYQLGGQDVTVKGKKAVLTKDPGVIAGSVTNLFDCMKNCVQNMGIPLEVAVLAATENPAGAIGVEEDYGKIAVGNYGNVLLLDQKLNIRNIIQKGRIMSI